MFIEPSALTLKKTVGFSQREDVLIALHTINSGCLPRELELVGLENGDGVCLLEGRTDVQGDAVMLGQVSAVSYSYQSERLCEHMSGSKWGLSFMGKVQATVHTVTV
jgi:hypothetical protein